MLHALKPLLLRGVQGLVGVEHIVGIATNSRSVPRLQIYFFVRSSLIIAVEGPEGWRNFGFRPHISGDISAVSALLVTKFGHNKHPGAPDFL